MVMHGIAGAGGASSARNPNVGGSSERRWPARRTLRAMKSAVAEALGVMKYSCPIVLAFHSRETRGIAEQEVGEKGVRKIRRKGGADFRLIRLAFLWGTAYPETMDRMLPANYETGKPKLLDTVR